MPLKRFLLRLCLIGMGANLCVIANDGLRAAELQPPDLTQGGKPDAAHDWTLGPTGARGWIFGHNLETTHARQILITRVDKGSPAEGILMKGDVIVGLHGKPFDGDPRIALGHAITDAEQAANRGELPLIRWRGGKETDVILKLKVLGTYSLTAPYDCPKSAAILDQGYEYFKKHGIGRSHDFTAPINALAVLATGRADLLPKVASLAHDIGRPNITLDPHAGLVCWGWGYNLIFLSEYYMATEDSFVLPAIRKYASAIAKGQSAVGTWGHDTSEPNMDGRLGGYGAINQAGLGCWLGMILSQKCGVHDPDVDRAVERTQQFFRFYVNKGSIPYGDHPPWCNTHDNNGKNSMAAVAFDLLGDGRATRFFGKMATASYDEREFGHTGNYFSYLWGALGVARCGSHATAAYMQEQQWYFDLARGWDGKFEYQGGAGEGDSYERWDMTGVFMLNYALPLAKLCITGRDIGKTNALDGSELKSTIEDGRGFMYTRMNNCYDGKTREELLKCLASWSPVVRFRAARALGHVDVRVVPQLIDLLRSGNSFARLGACQALEFQGSRAAAAVDPLIAALQDNDSWLQIRAAYALAGIGKAARKAVPTLLKLALNDNQHDDPRAMTRRYICLALFISSHLDDAPRHGLIADSLDGVDRQLLCPAIKQMLALDDGAARSQLSSIYGRLSDEDLQQLWPDIVRAVVKQAKSGEMFADEVRIAGLKLLAKHRVKEGMQLCIDYAKDQNEWGSDERMADILKALEPYGAAAQVELPALKELAAACRADRNLDHENRQRKAGAVENAIHHIEAAKDRPQLHSIAALLQDQERP